MDSTWRPVRLPDSGNRSAELCLGISETREQAMTPARVRRLAHERVRDIEQAAEALEALWWRVERDSALFEAPGRSSLTVATYAFLPCAYKPRRSHSSSSTAGEEAVNPPGP